MSSVLMRRHRGRAIVVALLLALVGSGTHLGVDVKTVAAGSPGINATPTGSGSGQIVDLTGFGFDPNVTVTNMGSYLLVNLPEAVTFPVDSAAVRADLQGDLRGIAANLVSYPNSTIKVLGHTDNTGTAAYNADLSQRRAIAVTNILIGAGVPAARVQAIGVGEDRPIASNTTEAGRAQNRRVEIIITPNQ